MECPLTSQDGFPATWMCQWLGAGIHCHQRKRRKARHLPSTSSLMSKTCTSIQVTVGSASTDLHSSLSPVRSWEAAPLWGHFLCNWTQVCSPRTQHTRLAVMKRREVASPQVTALMPPCPSVFLALSSEVSAYYYYFYKCVPSEEKIKYA